MAKLVLHDTVSLCHFGEVGRLNLLESQHAHLSEPRWTSAVNSEVGKGAKLGISNCSQVLTQGWLGTPMELSVNDLKKLMPIWIGLNDGQRPPDRHLGEAESIYLADKLDGVFMTDDNSAYDFASNPNRLGPGRVIDTVYVLRMAVALDEISADEAAKIASQMESRNRKLRGCHKGKLTASYFN